MDVSVRTGQTRSARDMSLSALPLETLHGERVCLLMEIIGDADKAKTVAHECEQIVKHALLEAEGDAAERLDSTLKEMNGLLKGMLISNTVQDVHMIICILDKHGMLHASHAGRAEVYLVRKGTASQITEYSSGKPTPAFVHISSGKIERNDMVVFSTQRLLRSVTPAQLARLAANRDTVVDMLERTLEADNEHAALATMDFAAAGTTMEEVEDLEPRTGSREPSAADRYRRRERASMSWLDRARGMMPSVTTMKSYLPSREAIGKTKDVMGKVGKKAKTGGASSLTLLSSITSMRWAVATRDWFTQLIADLHHPERKKRAHLLLIACAIAALVIIWAVVHLFTLGERSKTQADLQKLIDQINVEIQTAENRHIQGDSDAANAILDNAAQQAQQVMDNQSGMFRQEALNLLDQIQGKRESINNIVRISPRIVANLASASADIQADGLVGISDGEFMVFDKQNVYHVLLNTVEDPHPLTQDNTFIVDGTNLSRFQSQVFLMSDNSIIEWQNGQATNMKTDDPKGWMSGKAVDAYTSYLYVLSPENNQIYKYQRLNDRYGVPVQYNVNGDLKGALDMSIDGSVYVLKDGGTIVKLFRGENQPFVVRQVPTDALKNVTKIFKVTDRDFYLLDPTHARVIVLSDGGPTGESTYVRQYVLEGQQIGTLNGLYVDPDEAHLYVSDEKHVYVIDLMATK
ncbi:MAG TPA: hypothetical protein VHA78_02205 [Candidatus Peribacteraceae bacterium]|nr:hypothetical protein [Candidatus Peribacteraceae bacterium]